MKKIILSSVLSLAIVASSLALASNTTKVEADQTVVTSSSSAMIAPMCEYPGLSLRLGDGNRNKKTDDVKKLQRKLIERGYLKTEATGYFGPATMRAVKLLQAEQGISATGYVGALTLGSLKRMCDTPIAMCDYAAPPEGCTYVKGPKYDAQSQCGMVLSCGNGSGGAYEPTTSCQTWYDGCNTCSRQTPGGPALCTLRACINVLDNSLVSSGAKCTSYFSTTTPTTCSDAGKTYKEGQSTSCLNMDGQQICIADAVYVCRSGAWKIEGGYPIRFDDPVACTMEARLCPNGTMVPRDSKCGWHPEQCSQ